MRTPSLELAQAAETVDFGGGKDIVLATLSLGSVAVAETVPTSPALQYACLGVLPLRALYSASVYGGVDLQKIHNSLKVRF